MKIDFRFLKFWQKKVGKRHQKYSLTSLRPELALYCLSGLIFRIQFYIFLPISIYNSQQHQKYKRLNAPRTIFLIQFLSLLDQTQNPKQPPKNQTFMVESLPYSTFFALVQKRIFIVLNHIQKDHANQESKCSQTSCPCPTSPPSNQQQSSHPWLVPHSQYFRRIPLININKLLMLSSLIRRPFLQFSKICSSAEQAIKGIKDGSLLLVGGFGICGVPMNLINAVKLSGAKNLTIASNNCGVGDKDGKADWGLAVLLRTRQIKRMISSYVGENYQFQRQFFNGELELQICPQGTLAEKIRSGGAGIPAFFTATGVDTIIEKGGFPIKYKMDADGKVALDAKGQKIAEITSEPKPTAVFDNRKYVMEKSIFGDFALVKAKRADKMGNLQFEKTERNFNADMATAAKCVIAEVDEIVENGELDPQTIHTPAVYVDRVYLADPNSPFSAKIIEKLTVSDHLEKKKLVKERDVLEGKVIYNDGKISGTDKDHLRLKIAKRAAKQVRDGMNINLGIGIPTLLPSVLPEDIQINLQSENGIMGVGPYPDSHQVNANNINAGKETITLLPGGSYFSSSQSFSIIRGGHLDITMLGALQISENCDIANWIIPGKMMKGMGGAMDLVACGSKVIVLMEHSAKTKDGKTSLKLIQNCKLPLTAKGVVSMVITELAVFENRNGKLVLTEIAEGSSLEEVQSQTGFKLVCAQTIGRF